MTSQLSVPSIALGLLVVFPGLISLTVYRLIMPARALEWTNAIIQGAFYSAVNFSLSLPILWLLTFGYDPIANPGRYVTAAFVALLIGPALWPFILVKLFKSKAVAQRIQLPYPTAWDYFFDSRDPSFVLVHLADGSLIGGYWGKDSYAGSYPNDGDVYIEAVYHVHSDGTFGDRVADTRGLLLRKEQYTFLEFFSVPEEA